MNIYPLPLQGNGRRKPMPYTRLAKAGPFGRRCVIAWLFNEGGGTTAFDLSPSVNQGLYGYAGGAVPYRIIGPFGGPARSFTQASSTTGNNTSARDIPLGAAPRTVVVWSRRLSTAGGTLVSWGPASGAEGQSFIIQNYRDPPNIYVFTDGVNSANNVTVTDADRGDLNRWCQTAFTFDGSNWVYYKDGLARSSGTFAVTINTAALGSNGFGVGTRTDGVAQNWDGDVDHVLVLNWAASPGIIRRLYEEPFSWLQQPASTRWGVTPPTAGGRFNAAWARRNVVIGTGIH